MRLRHLVTVGPRPSFREKLSGNAEVTFASMDALADGVGGLDTSVARPYGEVAAGSYNFFSEGDLLLAKVTPCFENGKKAIARGLWNGIGFATSEVHVIRPKSDATTDRRYLLYLFCSEDFRAAGMASMTGSGGLRRVSEDAIRNFRISVPDLATQQAIADFLDRETARIDQLIEKKQRLVQLLEEREQADLALVFKSDAKPWRVRLLGKVRNGAGFPIEAQGDDSQEIGFFKVKHLKTFGLDAQIIDAEDTVSAETARKLRATVFPMGTIVFAKIGAALLLSRFSMLGRPACIDNNMAAFIPNEKLITPDFALLALSQIDMSTMVQPGAVPSMNTEAFYNFRLPLPEVTTQGRMVKSFRQKRQNLVAAKDKVTASIERLREYRSALITAAVTGQLDVSSQPQPGTQAVDATLAAEE